MILGIMQPYFFPYLGYFDLINCSDRWVVFDTAQYIRHGWVNRNRIFHPNEGWQYILVPLVKPSRETLIQDVEIKWEPGWHRRILGQISHYKKRAPYYNQVHALIDECLSGEERSLACLNVAALAAVCRYLDMPFRYEYFSRMNLEMGEVNGPGEWALRISEALGAKEYVNPPGGREIFDHKQFQAAGIRLTIRDTVPMEYGCRGREFISSLSIIDVLMWNSPEAVRDYLENIRVARSGEISLPQKTSE